MRTTLLCGLLLALAAAAPAQAQAPTFAGDICHARIESPPAGGLVAVVHGGPLAVADAATVDPDPLRALVDNPVAVTLTCSLQHPLDGHTGTPLWRDSASGLGVAAVPPAAVSFAEPAEWPVMCTQAAVTSRQGQTTTWYWDAEARAFSTDPGVSCGPMFCVHSVHDGCRTMPDEVVRSLVDLANDVVAGYVDPLLCPALRDVAPPEGDLAGVWDCPPYETR